MKRCELSGFLWLIFITITAKQPLFASEAEINLLIGFSTKNLVVSGIMAFIGIGIVGIWFKDIISGKFKGSFFRWREGENLLWPHILAEFLTAIGLIVAASGLLSGMHWAFAVALTALGSVIYSAINSTGWVLAQKERLFYGFPIWISLAGAIGCLIILVL